tara:strand:+ start:1937 stop:2188 length:252 start_codon:yes stop_codon:yes gene_type:complete
MRAFHKYKHSRAEEAQRRIAQSYGYKHTIFNDAQMLLLLQRAGIEFDSVDYTQPDDRNRSPKDFVPFTDPNNNYIAESETIKL